MLKRRNKQNAFTLIELLVVVIIIAALAGMVAPRLIGRSDEAKADIARGDMSNVDVALKLFRLDTGRYPSSEEGLQALMASPGSTENWKGPYLEKQAMDPWKQAYQYGYPGTHNSMGYDLFSIGKDAAEGTADDITNWQ